MSITKNIARYINDMGFNLSELSRKSGVAYGSLYASLKGERELRANELTDLCFVLHINPMEFAEQEERG